MVTRCSVGPVLKPPRNVLGGVLVAIGVLVTSCSSKDVADNCADIQKQCLDSGKCLDSSNRGRTEAEGEYGDQVSGQGSDEAECDIRCVSCETVSENSSGSSTATSSGGSSSSSTSDASSSSSTSDGSPSTGTGGAEADGGTETGGTTTSGTGGSSANAQFEGVGGACGLRAAAAECTSCLESDAECCDAATTCAGEEPCVRMWNCYQTCEVGGNDFGCLLECDNSAERAEAFAWSSLHNCLVQRCKVTSDQNACPAFNL